MTFKLSVHNAIADQIGGEALRYSAAMLGGLPAFSADDPSPAGYTDISSLANWDLYSWATALSFETYRNLLIDQYLGGWGALSNVPDRQILVSHYVCPPGTTEAELDVIWPVNKREEFRTEVAERLGQRDRVVRKSPNGKLWLITVDDAGSVVTQEVKTDVAL